jgi:hypothetical protein
MACLYTPLYLIGVFWLAPQTNMDDGDPYDVDMKSKGKGALDIYDDALIIAYLQACESPIGLTPKEKDRVVHRAKWFKWEGNSLLWMWANGQVMVVPYPEQHESLVRHVHEELGHFGNRQTYSLLQT